MPCWLCRETQILGNAKSVSVWQREFSKIVERRTFDLINYARKYVKLDKMVESTTIDNLGTPRTQNWAIIDKYLIRQLYQKLNVRECWCINHLLIIGQFSVLDVPRLLHSLFSSILSNITYFLV